MILLSPARFPNSQAAGKNRSVMALLRRARHRSRRGKKCCCCFRWQGQCAQTYVCVYHAPRTLCTWPCPNARTHQSLPFSSVFIKTKINDLNDNDYNIVILVIIILMMVMSLWGWCDDFPIPVGIDLIISCATFPLYRHIIKVLTTDFIANQPDGSCCHKY